MPRFLSLAILAVACSSAPMEPSPTSTNAVPTALAIPSRAARAATPGVTATASPLRTPTAVPGATPRATPAVAFGDGTHLIGEDVEPGTYRTVGYTENCYWVRFAGFDSGLEDWLASGIGPGYHVVTIGPDDAGFDSDGCGGWTANLESVAEPGDGIGEGTYIVGLDIEPGRWKASSGANCYWARLSGFGGTDAEIVAEQLTGEGLAPVVTIAETDAGFTSNGCGEWRVATP